ncbi:MAG: hypothetical protein GEV28_07125 [Actinophytocola sp.]|uniref:hypothetical protein n=1 Tax=Actinophytocola sp. TaxID=1872138 RepID=UPI00132A3871|nr:hypothetical protein [Actinophytocola sp.]MPZ80165.1 hypothetical protein [Actinophytocola sp.]
MSKRTTVTLTDQDEQIVRAFGDPDRPESAILRDTAEAHGIVLAEGASEAAVIRGLMAAGAAAIRGQLLERGYQRVAEMYSEVHDADEAAARRRRYADRVDRVMPG